MAQVGDVRLREEPNEYGVMRSVHRCLACGEEFTVTPAVPEGETFGGCQGPTCSSYDSSRDIDLFFENGAAVMEAPDGSMIIDIKNVE